MLSLCLSVSLPINRELMVGVGGGGVGWGTPDLITSMGNKIRFNGLPHNIYDVRAVAIQAQVSKDFLA